MTRGWTAMFRLNSFRCPEKSSTFLWPGQAVCSIWETHKSVKLEWLSIAWTPCLDWPNHWPVVASLDISIAVGWIPMWQPMLHMTFSAWGEASDVIDRASEELQMLCYTSLASSWQRQARSQQTALTAGNVWNTELLFFFFNDCINVCICQCFKKFISLNEALLGRSALLPFCWQRGEKENDNR